MHALHMQFVQLIKIDEHNANKSLAENRKMCVISLCQCHQHHVDRKTDVAVSGPV